MKKKSFGIISLLLGVTMAISCVGCKENNEESSNQVVTEENTTITGTVSDTDEHFVQNTLHDVNVVETNKDFVVNGQSDYKIVLPQYYDSNSLASAGMIQKYVQQSTGAKLEIIYDNVASYSADKKYIVVQSEKLFTEAGIEKPTQDLGVKGYFIRSKGNSAFIGSAHTLGITNGARRFLHFTVGFDMFSEDCIVLDYQPSEKWCEFNVTEKPDITHVISPNGNQGSDYRLGMGSSRISDVYMGIKGETHHNTFKLLPPATYAEEYPEFYSTDSTQLCLTARGDAEKYETMLNISRDVILEEMETQTQEYLILSREDVSTVCTCAACVAECQKYGTDSAAMIKFVNKLADKVNTALQERAKETGETPRKLIIQMNAYHKVVKPPVKKVDGKYVPIDEDVAFTDYTGVFYAPISANFVEDFYSPKNAAFYEITEGWAALCNNMAAWIYGTNFIHYLFPMNNFDTLAETYRYFYSKGCVYIYNQCQWDNVDVTAFGTLKEYMTFRLTWNVNESVVDIFTDFFKGYFGEAATVMRTYFDELQTHMEYLCTTYPTVGGGGIYADIEEVDYWSFNLLRKWENYIDEAYKAIEPVRKVDAERYAMLKKNILKESIFLRYALIVLHAGYFSDGELKERQLAFRDDCKSIPITHVGEGKSLDSTYVQWGI